MPVGKSKAAKPPNKWAHLKEVSDDDRKDVEEAEDARKKKIVTSSRSRSGASDLPPFDGATKEESDAIREIVALDLGGYSQAVQCERAGITLAQYHSWRKRLSRAFEQAERSIVEQGIRRYHRNMLVIKITLTESGPRAVRVLREVMDDPKTPANHRINAATQLLKLVDIDNFIDNLSGTAEIKDELVGLIKETREEISRERIVDAENVTVIEDGNDSSSNPD